MLNHPKFKNNRIRPSCKEQIQELHSNKNNRKDKYLALDSLEILAKKKWKKGKTLQYLLKEHQVK